MDLRAGTMAEATLRVRPYEDPSTSHRTQTPAAEPRCLRPALHHCHAQTRTLGCSPYRKHTYQTPMSSEAESHRHIRSAGPGHVSASWPKGHWECVFLASSMGSWNRKWQITITLPLWEHLLFQRRRRRRRSRRPKII